MPTMTADHNQVRFYLIGKGMNFSFRASEDEMLVFGRNAKGFGKFFEMCPGSFLNLFLDRGQIHWDVTTISKAQRFDDVGTTQFRATRRSQRARTLRHMPRLFRQVNGHQNVGIFSQNVHLLIVLIEPCRLFIIESISVAISHNLIF